MGVHLAQAVVFMVGAPQFDDKNKTDQEANGMSRPLFVLDNNRYEVINHLGHGHGIRCARSQSELPPMRREEAER